MDNLVISSLETIHLYFLLYLQNRSFVRDGLIKLIVEDIIENAIRKDT